ncbi:uncharacterized protein LOC126835340 [Adelges cooleyi]|uniref:uncharacterized protein LOC126835340 n=1 Tax=Adelges cooleyi TaxID=133065 RepID=UPI0021806144|nr:uncharacterized protein LOC126835340 [Adelges cooleyi]XP_050423802.1 uncharacterized protein LOC126835340 [Adelges cooleyi]
MKLLFVLISFALVGHVLLVAELEEYIELVTFINDDIKQAKEFMPTVIKYMVERPNVYGIEAMVMMLALPDRLDRRLREPKFSYKNPEGIIFLNQDPDQIIVHYEDKVEFQKMMQSAISAVTNSNQNLDPPTVLLRALNLDPNLASSSDPNQNLDPSTVLPDERFVVPTKFKTENLAGLLIKRNIQPIGTHRIIRSLALTSLASARKVMTLEAITTLLRQNHPLLQNLGIMCHLAAIFRSIKYSTFIQHIELDGNYCFLMNETNSDSDVYGFIGDEFWNINRDTWFPVMRFSSEYQ